jgi:hypothetical protein
MQYHADVYNGGSMTTPSTTAVGDIILVMASRQSSGTLSIGGTLSGLTTLQEDTSDAPSMGIYYKTAVSGDNSKTVTWSGSGRRGSLVVFRPSTGETVDSVDLITLTRLTGTDTWTIGTQTTDEGDVLWCGSRVNVNNRTFTTEDSDLTVLVNPTEYGTGHRGIFSGYDIMGSGETSSPQYQNVYSASDTFRYWGVHIKTSVDTIDQGLTTDSANAITVAKLFPAQNQATSTDSANAVTAAQGVGVNQATTTDTANTVTLAFDHPVGQAQETDEAFPVSTTVIVNQATSTDTANSVTVSTGFTGWGIPM